MARQARIVVQGHPHHVVHRGNLRAQVFFSDDDRRFYLEMLAQCATRFGVETHTGTRTPDPGVVVKIAKPRPTL